MTWCGACVRRVTGQKISSGIPKGGPIRTRRLPAQTRGPDLPIASCWRVERKGDAGVRSRAFYPS